MVARSNTIIRNVVTTASRYQSLLKLLPLLLMLLALATGVIAEGMPGGSACPGC